MSNLGLVSRHTGEMLALKEVDVVARVAGLLAETSVTQRYRNDTAGNLELAYTFPLPVGANLLSFEVRIGERCYTGEVVPRREAEAAYEAAIAEGDSAFRLQKVRPGMYSATLGNVLAGESVEITLSYAEILVWNGKSIRYRLPTTIAPRFGNPRGLQPWQRPVTSLGPEYPLGLTLTILGPLAQGTMNCPSHKVAFKPGADVLEVRLAAGATLDRDFILEIEPDTVQSLGIMGTARDTHMAMLTLLPPEVEHQGHDRDTVIVIDCSGSMQGDSLRLAKDGVQLSLGSLGANERFGLIAFGSSVTLFDPELQPANRKNLDMARHWVNGLGDMGGTELAVALEQALALHAGQPMDILLLTDGETWNLGEVIARARGKGVRIFTLGVGAAVAEDTVRSLADGTGGACELVFPNEDMSGRIFRHFNRMRQPGISRLDIQWPAPPLWEFRPEAGCFAGDSYTVMAAFAEPPMGSVGASFVCDGAPPVTLDAPLTHADTVSDAIVRMAAWKRLEQMPMPEQMPWAVRYQLITEHTDYLIQVERTAEEKPGLLPDLQVVPQMLPAGWGGTSTVLESGICCSVPMGSIDYDQLANCPAVVRKRSVSIEPLDSDYTAFIKKLNASAGRLRIRGLPGDRRGLTRLCPPKEVLELLDAMEGEGHGETDIIRAFYHALLEHDGRDRLTDRCRLKLASFIGGHELDAALVQRWLEVLDQLFMPWVVDRYDIPAFLRKHAD